MRPITTFVFTTMVVTAISQGFERNFDKTGFDTFFLSQDSHDPQYHVFAFNSMQGLLDIENEADYTLMRLDLTGETLDSLTFSTSGEYRRCIGVFSSNGGWDVIEDCNDFNTNRCYFRMHHINSEFQVEDTRVVAHNQYYRLVKSASVRKSPEGGYLILSVFRHIDSSPPYPYGLFRFSSELDSIHSRYFDLQEQPALYDIIQLSLNDIRLSTIGLCENVQNNFMATFNCLQGYDSLFSPTSSFRPEIEVGYDNPGLLADSDTTFLLHMNHYVPAGLFETTDDYSVYRLDHEFNKLDSVILGQTDTSLAYNRTETHCLDLLPNGDIYVGDTYDWSYSINTPFPYPSWIELYKLDNDLDVIWRRFYGGDAWYWLTGVQTTYDGGSIMFANRADLVDDWDEADLDAYIIKVGPDGELTGLNESSSLRTVELSIFPNPANETLTIITDLNHFQFALRNSVGQVVFQTNAHGSELGIDISRFPRGTYLYTLIAKSMDFRTSGKVVLD